MWMCFLCESHPGEFNHMGFLMFLLMVLVQANAIYESSQPQKFWLGQGFALLILSKSYGHISLLR